MTKEREDRFPLERRHLLAGGATASVALGGWFLLGTGPPDGPGVLGDEIAFEPSFGLRLTRSEPNGRTMELSGRFAGPDHYIEYESADNRVESYRVDGDSYVVVDGECRSYPGLDDGVPATLSPPDDPGPDPSEPALERTGTTTIEGTDVFVFELDAGDAEVDGSVRYYVESETGYLRRLENGATVVAYRDWGDVSPIRPPDLDCRTVR